MADRICGAQHPKNNLVVCTKPEGHEGRHGRPAQPMRCVLWDMRPKIPAKQ